MADNIEGSGANPTPHISAEQAQRMYKAQYKEAATLFENTLDEHAKSTNPFQQDKFRDVMDQSMKILNEAAAGLKQSKLIEQNKQIAKDYAEYQDDGSKAAKANLHNDLEAAKKAIS